MRSRRGSTMVEFMLVGIPVLFIVISTMEMARGMWLYHTVAHAARAGTRYAAIHGRGCVTSGNSCAITVGDVAARVAAAGIGLAPGAVSVTLTSAAGPVQCAPLSACLGDARPWPPLNANAPGMDVAVAIQYQFRSALAMFWPGQGTMQIGTATFKADSRQRIQF